MAPEAGDAREAPREASRKASVKAKVSSGKNPLTKLRLDPAWTKRPSDPRLATFYARRKHLFSRFDEGIALSEEMYYSVMPEAFGEHVAEKICRVCPSLPVLDLFGGAGGQAISMASRVPMVYTVEYNLDNFAQMQNNVRVYGLTGQVIMILGDVFELAEKLAKNTRFACVTMSPPWGGLSYRDQEEFDLRELRMGEYKGDDLLALVEALRPHCDRCTLHLPRTTSVESYRALRRAFCAPGQEEEDVYCELEEMQYAGQTKMVTVYLGAWG